MSGGGSSPAWTWRKAVTKSGLSSTTRLVLLTLSTHMNDQGESCYPSLVTQAEETGLSKQSVITHLAIAENAGWLTTKRHGYGDQRYNRNEYFARLPNGWLNKQTGQIYKSAAHAQKAIERRSKVMGACRLSHPLRSAEQVGVG